MAYEAMVIVMAHIVGALYPKAPVELGLVYREPEEKPERFSVVLFDNPFVRNRCSIPVKLRVHSPIKSSCRVLAHFMRQGILNSSQRLLQGR